MEFREIMIGVLVMILGFFVVYTFISPDFLFLIGIDVGTYNSIQSHLGIWWPVIGICIILAGLIAMKKFGD